MLADLLSLAFLTILLVLMVVDVFWPARRFPKVRLWRLKGIVFTLILMVVSTVLPFLWDEWLGAHRVLDLTGLGTLGGAVVGLLAHQFLGYWWHRALHRIPLLWRIHQMHHSAERIDIYGANLFHPLDMVGWTFLPSFSLVLVFGVTPEAAAIAAITSNVLAILGHANIRTPRWMGYLFQRPENHAVHHQRGVHANNYGDIALWDMVFGTWKNPETFDGVGGFYDGASSRIGEMLLGLDVTKPSRRVPKTLHSALRPSQSGSYAQ